MKNPHFSRFATGVLGCLLALSAQAELADTEGLNRYLAAAIESRGIPGAVALVVDADGVLFTGAYGQRNVADGVAMTNDSIFRIASMTKPIAATAIMMLVEEGKLSLDDEIADLLPDSVSQMVIENFNAADGSYTTRPAERPITLRQLLSHSSGLAYGFGSSVVTRLNQQGVNGTAVPLLYDPGEAWSYGGGIAIVARALEQIEGRGLDEFLRQRLFGPLGMSETAYVVPAALNDRVVTIHNRDAAGNLVEAANPASIRSGVSGDGGLHTTAADYARFIQLILNDGVAPGGERLLSSASIAELGRNQLGAVKVTLQDEALPNLARAFPLGADRDGFGLGFQVTGAHDEDGLRAPGSMSWAGIYNTEFWIDPATGIGAVLMLQYLPFYDADAIALLTGFEQQVYARIR